MADIANAKDLASQKIGEAKNSVTGFDTVLDVLSHGGMTTGALKQSATALDYELQEAQYAVDLNLGQMTSAEYQEAIAGLETKKESALDKIQSSARVTSGIQAGIQVASVGLTVGAGVIGSKAASATKVSESLGTKFMSDVINNADEVTAGIAKAATSGTDDVIKYGLEIGSKYGDDVANLGNRLLNESDDLTKGLIDTYGKEAVEKLGNLCKNGLTDDGLRSLVANNADDSAKLLTEAVNGSMQGVGSKVNPTEIANALTKMTETSEGRKALQNVLKQNGDEASKAILDAMKGKGDVGLDKAIKDIVNKQSDDALKGLVNALDNTTSINAGQRALGKIATISHNAHSGVNNFAGKLIGNGHFVAGSATAVLGHGGIEAVKYAPAIATYAVNGAINKNLQEQHKEHIRENCLILAQMENSLSSMQDSELYQNFAESVYNYNESLAGISDMYDAKQITEDQYNQYVSELNDSFDDYIDANKQYLPEELQGKSMSEIHDYFKRADQQITGNDPYMALAANGKTADEINKQNGYIAERADEETKAAAKKLEDEGYDPDKYKNGLASNGFTAFFMTLNARMIQACPFVAKLEAAILKVADASFDKVADFMTGGEHAAKYQGQSVTDIANQLVQDSSTHLAMIDANSAIQQACADNKDYSDGATWNSQNREEEADNYVAMLESIPGQANSSSQFVVPNETLLANKDDEEESEEKQSGKVSYTPSYGV